MEIIVGKTAGFCFGVENAVSKAKEALQKEKVYCLGELVHNPQVTEDLKKSGIEFIDNIDKKIERPVIIRSHGESIDTYKKAKENNIELIDLTCPKVLKTHKIAEEYAKKNYYIFLIGKTTHPETVATISYCGNLCTIIENIKDVNIALEKLNKSRDKKLISYFSNNL